MTSRRKFLALAGGSLGLLAGAGLNPTLARPKTTSGDVLHQWFDLLLELVRHTPTYSPPVASRAFAYVAVTAYEAVACCDPTLLTIAGQLQGLAPLPPIKAARLAAAVVLHAALAAAMTKHFGNTGPTGQRAMLAQKRKLDKALAVKGHWASVEAGEAIAAHIFTWSEQDGGAHVQNMGFPEQYKFKEGNAHWQPTNAIRLQQMPLLPGWGNNRTFAMPNSASCALPPPLPYSEDLTSAFYKEAREVYDTGLGLTAEHKRVARFWSDDPMLSPTPPGHWMFIANDLLKQQKAGIADSADLLMRLGVAVADAFIGCWQQKFAHDLLRPVTYIKRVIDKSWEPLLITPPFPEYPSGHSTQSGAAEIVLAQYFGANFAFEDRTHQREKLPARRFASFRAAAEEAALSRLYGGIHFRSGNEQGLLQGRCIGAFAAALKTRRPT